MGKDDYKGKRKSREDLRKVRNYTGTYLILTDIEKTEKNYLNGFKDDAPQKTHCLLVRLFLRHDFEHDRSQRDVFHYTEGCGNRLKC